ncbi:MAG TPA: hypothetical protein VFB44_14495 [Thermoleophilaceae bacterium]|nr:hypothetical protein [Thermoleophilaceae bacterium]
MRRFRDTATIEIPLPASRALPLFTARGERAWVPGWKPRFPAGEPDDEDEGTVWVTEAHGRTTYWVVATRDARGVAYARVTPELFAGIVEVRQRRADARSTQLEITYDLTALTDAGAAELDSFAAGYHEEIRGWRAAIEATIA